MHAEPERLLIRRHFGKCSLRLVKLPIVQQQHHHLGVGRQITFEPMAIDPSVHYLGVLDNSNLLAAAVAAGKTTPIPRGIFDGIYHV